MNVKIIYIKLTLNIVFFYFVPNGTS